MRIGLDFDNTIVCYDDVFHLVAVEQGAVPQDTPKSKVAVRDHMRVAGIEDQWTEMQGYVYGARMDDVSPYPNVIDTLIAAKKAGHELFIVSHKTKHPFMGPKYDLHAAASAWIQTHLLDASGEPLIPAENMNFREVKSEKIDRIGELECDIFIDDLPEILLASNYPESTKAVLFDPADHHEDFTAGARVQSWQAFKDVLGL